MKDLRSSFAESPLAIKPDHLEKLVCELVDNACKFSVTGQPVKATGEIRDAHYVITITDQGRGMTPEEIETLGPMVQIDRVRVMQGGVGLGFAISRALAIRHGGTLHVRPNGDRGVTIEVTLPIAS